MVEPIDHQIVQEIARIFARIKKENGYRTDFGMHVQTEEDLDEVPDTETSIEIYDETEVLETQNSKSRTAKLSLRADLIVYVDPEATDGARLLARRGLLDMRKALTLEERQLPIGVSELKIGGRTINSREDGSNYLVASLDLSATFLETY